MSVVRFALEIAPKGRLFAASLLAGVVGLALITLVCFRFSTGLSTPALLDLVLVSLVSYRGNVFASAILAIFALGCLDYFFVSPTFDFRIDNAERAMELALFLAVTLLVNTLTAMLRASAEALRRSNDYLAASQQLSGAGTSAFNVKSAVFWSEENYRIWGLDPLQGVPKRETMLQRIHPDDRQRVIIGFQDALREKREFTIEFRIVLPEGKIKHIESSGRPMFASDESIDMVASFLDVTQRKRAQEEHQRLRQLESDIAYMSRVTTMGELAASLAHEVKQPIAAATIDAGTALRWLTLEPPDIQEARESLSRIQKTLGVASAIVERTRALFKREAPRRELVRLNEIIREMVAMLYDEATQHAVFISAELDTALPALTADPVQLQQVLMNLMLNGIEAMTNNGGKLTVTSKQDENGYQLVSVSDEGTGLPEGETERLFAAFFTTKPQGTGMGLSISRTIIELHGGRLWAEPNHPRGATFQFTLRAGLDGS